MRATIFSTVVLGCLVAACGPKATSGAQGDDDGDDTAQDGGGGSGDDDPSMDSDAMTCGAQTADIGVQNLGPPPDLLVILDRSGSMTSPIFSIPINFTSKWDIMKGALGSTVMGHQQQIKFGLRDFPSDNNCGASATPNVPIALNNAAAVSSYFASRSPDGNTPAYLALQGALTYYNSIPVNPAGRYVLFATDGIPNCLGGVADTASDAETIQAVADLKTAGIKTFVLGFGDLGSGSATLNSAAVAGGVPQAGATKFYNAANGAELEAALQSIAGGIIMPSCSFALASAPPDPNNVTVTVNGMAVPRSPSHGNGWDYSPNASTITFFGTYCDEIMTGASTNVNFSYGCPGPVIQ
ncbi:MAG TPA: vWA domain-containing protein [Kofleriaceae bacterium]|jgi:WD40 repeat protein